MFKPFKILSGGRLVGRRMIPRIACVRAEAGTASLGPFIEWACWLAGGSASIRERAYQLPQQSPWDLVVQKLKTIGQPSW